MNELKISDFQPKLPKIESNYEEVKQNVLKVANQYKGILLTEESLPAGKKDLANLRKLRKSITDYVRDVKKEWNLPFDDFKAQMDELTDLLDEPIEEINMQVKDFEQRAKDEKEEAIKEIFERLTAEAEEADYLSFTELWNDRWLNKTYKLEDIEKELAEAVEKNEKAVKSIKALDSDHIPEFLDVYRRTGSLEAVFEEQARLKRLDEERAELQRQREEKQKAEEAEKAEREKQLAEEAKAKAEEIEIEDEPELELSIFNNETESFDFDIDIDLDDFDEDEEFDYLIKLEATAEEYQKVVDFLVGNNIKYYLEV